MTNETDSLSLPRRRYIALAGMTGSIALAGCTGGNGSNGNGNGDGESNTLTIQHWWTSGGEGEAMEDLQAAYEEKYPDFEVDDDPVAGGGGDNLQSVIRSRVLEENPPSTWQDWPGRNLADYVEAGVLKDIGYIYEGEMEENYRDVTLTAARAGDDDNPLVCVPLNIHRINNLFYDIPAVEEAGVDPEDISDPNEYVEVLGQLDDALDRAAMALDTADSWTVLQLWESNLLGLHGAEAYDQFMNGEDVTSEVEEALEVTLEQMEYTTSDASSIGSDEAREKLPQGDAATMMEGDFAAAQWFPVDDYQYDEDWGHVQYPGSDGIYDINTDGFPYPKPNPSPDATDAWMKWVGSVEAQEMFTNAKAAIPPRADANVDDFHPLLQKQFEDYQEDKIVLTVTHGDGATPQQDTALKDTMSRFTDQQNVGEAATALHDAIQK